MIKSPVVAVATVCEPPTSVPAVLHIGLEPVETAAPAGYPTASDEASEKPSPTAKVAMSPS